MLRPSPSFPARLEHKELSGFQDPLLAQMGLALELLARQIGYSPYHFA
ncbi:hypothetical protein [Ktedonosporobacter rubrisoli]|nr:hypothetical protein [Ktedonosporobacter rubrisoli]